MAKARQTIFMREQNAAPYGRPEVARHLAMCRLQQIN